MEDNVQRVFAILISVIMFFLLPLYIAFEKKDDIAYSLALRITSSFVDNVTSKGYLTYDMYEEYVSDLTVTDNVYDINIEYIAKQYNPIIQVYNKNDPNNILIEAEYDFIEKQTEFRSDKNALIPSGLDKTKCEVALTYKMSELRYSTDQILQFLDGSSDTYLRSDNYALSSIDNHPAFPRIYGLKNEGVIVMNEGDQFNIIIKNKNTTIATVLFNSLTFGANAGNDTKVYINYGGTIQNQEYMPKLMGDIDGNGKVDLIDKDLIDDYKDGLVNFSLTQKIVADKNKDGVIDAKDKE